MSYASTVSSLGGLSEESRSLLVRSATAEELAAEILHRKSMLVQLDKQRQECTQALATFREKKNTTGTTASSTIPNPTPSIPSSLRAPPPAKLWVTFATGFVKMPRKQVAEMLQADRTKLDEEIAEVRAEMKELMAKLQNVQQSLNIPKGLLDFALKQ